MRYKFYFLTMPKLNKSPRKSPRKNEKTVKYQSPTI